MGALEVQCGVGVAFANDRDRCALDRSEQYPRRIRLQSRDLVHAHDYFPVLSTLDSFRGPRVVGKESRAEAAGSQRRYPAGADEECAAGRIE